MIESEAREIVVRLTEARHENQVGRNVDRVKEGVEQVGFVFTIAKMILENVGGGRVNCMGRKKPSPLPSPGVPGEG